MSTLQTWTRYDAPSDELADWWQMVVGFRTFYDVVMSFLSLRFSHHFPGGRGVASTVMSPSILAVIGDVRMMEVVVMEVVVTTGAIRLAKLQ